MKLRICKLCNIEKELSNIYFQPSLNKKNNKIYFKKKCRECEKNICKNYHKNNRDNILNRKRNYDFEHKQEKIDYRITYNSKPESKLKNNKRALKRYHLNKNNPIFILRRRMSSMISKQLKKSLSSKNRISVLHFLPFNLIEFKIHLEKQFDKNMNWNNYDKYWHIDHIIPQSDLPYSNMEDKNFLICWDLNNLRPLEAKQNITDGARRIRHKKT